MTKLIKASEWRIKTFSGDEMPDLSTVRRWIRDHKIAGRIIGGTYFVEEDEVGSTGDDIVDQILKAG